MRKMLLLLLAMLIIISLLACTADKEEKKPAKKTAAKKKIEGAITTALNSISIFDKLTLFVTGIFSLSAIVFFVSVVVIFLFLSIQTLEKRRWS